MAWRRRTVIGLALGVAAALAGCGGGGGFSEPATSPPSAFQIRVEGEDSVLLRYTGIGSQSTARFRVILEGGVEADGAYDLEALTGDPTWSDDDRFRLDRESLGLSSPLRVDGLTVELQYDDDGTWRTLRRETLGA